MFRKRMPVCLLALLLCLVAGAALADGGAQLLGTQSGTSGRLFTTLVPTEYTTQTDENIFFRALDGRADTTWSYTAWSSKAKDDIPEVELRFNRVTLGSLWIRNGYQSDETTYYNYARIKRLDVEVYSDSGIEIYQYALTDKYDPGSTASDWVYGYQRVQLPRTLTGVTQVNLWIKGWYTGNESTYRVCMSDIGFTSGSYAVATATPRLTATPKPTATPRRVTATPKPTATPRPAAPGPWGWGPQGGDTGVMEGTNIWDFGTAVDGGDGFSTLPSGTTVSGSILDGSPDTAFTGETIDGLIDSSVFKGIKVPLKQRLATRSGPGTKYTELGSYFSAGQVVTAYSAVYNTKTDVWWVQVGFTSGGEQRRAYTGLKRLDMDVSQVPVEFVQATDVVVKKSVYAYYGPGAGYSRYKAKIKKGTVGTVYLKEGDYVQFEFYDETEGKWRRVWVPESALDIAFG